MTHPKTGRLQNPQTPYTLREEDWRSHQRIQTKKTHHPQSSRFFRGKTPGDTAFVPFAVCTESGGSGGVWGCP